MRGKLLLAILGVLLVVWGFTTAIVSGQAAVTTLPPTISGIVTDGSKALPNAMVQIQATTNTTTTDENGAFTLGGIAGSAPIVVSAWANGFHVGWVTLDPAAPDYAGGDRLTITLQELPGGDNADYEWYTFNGVDGSAACGECHREYTEWQADAHSRSATNNRFITMYTGTDVNGNEGQPVQYGDDGIALPHDPSLPYYGPGFKLDNPSRAGNCATCHTPVAGHTPADQNCAWSGCHTSLTIERSNGVIKPAVLPINLRGDAAEGITCEFCHKVNEVYIDRDTGLPYPDMPGILSMRLHRPKDDSQQVFFGTLIDVTRPDSVAPIESQSAFCAGCHYGVFGGVVGMEQVKDGTVIYNSYGEWLDSPYSDPATGKTCQSCHMPTSDADWFVFPDKGGLTRDYTSFHNHTMPGASDETLLQNAVSMNATADRISDQLQVEVSLTNDNAGHDVPTDAPMRSMILVVEALDADGTPLALVDGSTNPDYSGDLAGMPGKTFAKILRDDWTGETPTSAFWRPVTIVTDNPLVAMTTDTSRYTFDAPAGAVTVNVRLLFRRTFYELQQQKGFGDPDILMEHETIQLPAN